MSFPMRKVKLKDTTILKEQTSKLQQKLSLLRSQVTQKKKEKEMNQSSRSSFRNTAKTDFSKKDGQQKSNQQSEKLEKQGVSMKRQQQKSNKVENRLVEKLKDLKMQGMQDKLKEKGILSIDKLAKTQQQQIDQWKDIAVGWRIKLKKLIKTLVNELTTKISNTQQVQIQKEKTTKTLQIARKSQEKITIINQSNQKQNRNSRVIQNSNETNIYQSNENNKSQEDIGNNNGRDIERIIKNRKEVKVFVPMNRKYEEQEDTEEMYDQEYIVESGLVTNQDEQQRLMNKLMKAFQPRKPILQKYSKILSKSQTVKEMNELKDKSLSWSESVEQLERNFISKSHKTYPKQLIVKQALIEMHNNETIISFETGSNFTVRNQNSSRNSNQTQYCWRCFKKVNRNNINNMNISNDNSKTSIDNGGKSFCSMQCLDTYNSQSDLFQKHQNQQKYEL